MVAAPTYGKSKYVSVISLLTLTYFNIIKEIRWALQELRVLKFME